MLEAMLVRRHLAREERPFRQGHDPRVDVWRQKLSVRVRALVVVQVEVLDSDETVELDPLDQIGRLVPVDRANRQIRAHAAGARRGQGTKKPCCATSLSSAFPRIPSGPESFTKTRKNWKEVLFPSWIIPGATAFAVVF